MGCKPQPVAELLKYCIREYSNIECCRKPLTYDNILSLLKLYKSIEQYCKLCNRNYLKLSKGYEMAKLKECSRCWEREMMDSDEY